MNARAAMQLMAIHPAGVDLTRLTKVPFRAEPTGFDGDPRRASAERGKALLDIKIKAAVRQISLASPSQEPAFAEASAGRA